MTCEEEQERRSITIAKALEEIADMDLAGQAERGGFSCEPIHL